jgi:CheY-like chemotaxis protein
MDQDSFELPTTDQPLFQVHSAPTSPAPLGAPTVVPAPGPVSSAGIDLSQVHILLVEDDTVLQELYFERFSRSGFTVFQAFDGEEAVALVRDNADIDIVLLDLMLPKLSGFDVLMTIRQQLKRTDLPVVVVSALSDIDDQARSLQLGANEYITKGEVLPGTVIEKINRYALTRKQQVLAQQGGAPAMAPAPAPAPGM